MLLNIPSAQEIAVARAKFIGIRQMVTTLFAQNRNGGNGSGQWHAPSSSSMGCRVEGSVSDSCLPMRLGFDVKGEQALTVERGDFWP